MKKEKITKKAEPIIEEKTIDKEELVNPYENIEELATADILATIPKDDTAVIVVPLYGFYSEHLVEGLDAEVLMAAMFRLRSFFHKVNYIFVGERGRVDSRVMQVLMGKKIAGNAKGVEVEPYATYSLYLEDGIRYALENTDSKYVICANPWIMLGKDSFDVLLERINRLDVGACSGLDVRKDGISAGDFDSHKYNPAQEFRGFDINFFGFTRPIAESISIDTTYKTKMFVEQDILQKLHQKGYNVITSQSVPYYSFSIDWSILESDEDYAEDLAHFKSKWNFEPLIKHD